MMEDGAAANTGAFVTISVTAASTPF